MTDFTGVIRTLVDGQIDFILVGGVAATVHGSARLTRDVDVVYSRTPANMKRLVEAPAGLPFSWDVNTIQRGLNFTLTTRLGDIDLLGELTGGGGFEQLQAHASNVRLFDRDVPCLDLDWLIRVKRAAGRPRDLEAVAELEALREERDRE
jgi:hypothetical protein